MERFEAKRRAVELLAIRCNQLLDEAATRRKKDEFMYKLLACLIPGTIIEEFTMKRSEQTRFDTLYRRHLRALKLQGMSDSTLGVYARAVRRVAQRGLG